MIEDCSNDYILGTDTHTLPFIHILLLYTCILFKVAKGENREDENEEKRRESRDENREMKIEKHENRN